MRDSQLRLPLAVHVCRSGRDFVFLDRQRDAYTGIAGPPGEALEACLAGGEASAALEPLFAEGLLARAGEPGRPFELAVWALPSTATLLDHEAPLPGRPELSALRGCLRAHQLLRRSPFDRVCAAAERAAATVRSGRPEAAPRPEAFDEAARTFARTRRWYPRAPGCLFDSLSLFLYLARRGLAAQWIFGVRLAPWAAHCWVQAGDHLVGAPLETTAGFAPIMRIG